jgi:hypothetical protein
VSRWSQRCIVTVSGRGYRLEQEAAAAIVAASARRGRPSIAVLPFDNMSGDPGQEYFVDGMAEEILTALSRIRWLYVIARNSSLTYKGQAVDVKQVGRELGGVALAGFGEDIDAMMALLDRALAFNPSYARGWHISGVLRYWAGQPDAAITRAEAGCASARVRASARRC